MKRAIVGMLAAVCLPFSVNAADGAGTTGTYMLEGSAYRISVEFAADGKALTVVEPNKRSVYGRVPGTTPPVYEFTNPTNGIKYGLRVLGPDKIAAFKPDVPGNAPTTLVLEQAQARPDPEALGDQAGFDKLAREYLQLAQTDRVNTQTWAFCSGTARALSALSGQDAAAYQRQAAAGLKAITVDTSVSPCPKVIPASVWEGAR